jgi:hypothetical protein
MERRLLTSAAVVSVILLFVLFAEASVEHTLVEGGIAAEQPANITWKCTLCHAKKDLHNEHIANVSTVRWLALQAVES